MEFEKFKKHIDRILNTREKEEKLSKCIEKKFINFNLLYS